MLINAVRVYVDHQKALGKRKGPFGNDSGVRPYETAGGLKRLSDWANEMMKGDK